MGSGASSAAEVRVEYDQACVQCEYQLRGLPVTGVCPECATPIVRSFRGYWLSAADPEYVRSLYLGARLLTGAVMALLLAWIGFAVLGIVAGDVSHALFLLLMAGAWTLPAIAAVIGVFKLSAPDPERLDGARLEIGRAMARPGAVACAGGLVAALWLEVAGVGDTLASGLALAVALLGALALFGGLGLLLWSVARRSSERRLPSRLRTIAIFLALTVALIALRDVWPGLLLPLSGLSGFITFLLSLGFIDHLRAALQRDLAAARALRSPPAPPDSSAPTPPHPQPPAADPVH